MKKVPIAKLLKGLSLLLFMAGVLCFIWSIVSLNRYFQTNCDNFLPPAGSFLKGPDSFTFAVLSDSGLRNEPLHAVIRAIKKKPVKFIFHLGDQARKLSANHFEHVLQDLNSVLGGTPFYAVPGNHDTISKGEYTLRYYNRAFGQPHYWFGYGNTLFVALNTSHSDFPSDQQQWLDRVLTKVRPDFKSCVVVMHVPPEDPRPGKSYAMASDQDALGKILAKHKVTAIICGHIHEYNRADFAGVPMYIVPPSGQKMRGKTVMYGYLLCTVESDGKLTVTKEDVTDKKGRNYLDYFLSTEFDGIHSSMVSFLLFAGGFLLLLFSGQRQEKKTRHQPQ